MTARVVGLVASVEAGAAAALAGALLKALELGSVRELLAGLLAEATGEATVAMVGGVGTEVIP